MYSGKVDRVTIPEGSLALIAADEKARIPCNAFLNAEHWTDIIQPTSLSWEQLEGVVLGASSKSVSDGLFFCDEIKALRVGLVQLDCARTPFC